MNILVLSWRDPKHPLAGGAEQVMHEHMKGWIEAGHKVTLFSSKIKNLSSNENLNGVEIIRNGNQYIGVQIKAFFYYLRNHKKIDLVVDQFHGIPFFTPLYVTKPKLAVLQEVAKEVWFKNPLRFPLNIIIGLLGFLSEPFVFLFYKNCEFMVGSDSAKKDLIKFGIKNKNITIVPHGVILPKHLPLHTITNPKTITYFGPLTADKGIMDALDTYRILNSSGNYNFCIIGRPETDFYYQKVMNKAREYKIIDKITFWARPSDNEKFEILSKSYIFINPSVREGWGLVNIEANAVGTPVVAYNSPGLVDSVKNSVSGIIINKNSPEEMANAINELLEDKEKYQKLSNTAKKWSEEFDWKRSKNISLTLINKIV